MLSPTDIHAMSGVLLGRLTELFQQRRPEGRLCLYFHGPRLLLEWSEFIDDRECAWTWQAKFDTLTVDSAAALAERVHSE